MIHFNRQTWSIATHGGDGDERWPTEMMSNSVVSLSPVGAQVPSQGECVVISVHASRALSSSAAGEL